MERATLTPQERAKQDVRRSVLAVICRYWFDRNKSALASDIERSPDYVNNLLADRNSFGEKAADYITSALKIPKGSLDIPWYGPLGPRESKPFEARRQVMLHDSEYNMILDWREMPEPLRSDVKRMIENNSGRNQAPEPEPEAGENLQ